MSEEIKDTAYQHFTKAYMDKLSLIVNMNHYNNKGATTPKNILGQKKKGDKEKCPWIDKAASRAQPSARGKVNKY